MKKFLSLLLCIAIAFSLAACEKKEYTEADIKESYSTGYKEGYNEGHDKGYNEGKIQAGKEKHFARFSGSFTATVNTLLSDGYALPGKTVAMVNFFQDRPFLLQFDEDMTDKLVEGRAYVFDFKTFEVAIPNDMTYPDILNYMYSISITNYRFAEENEMGLSSKVPTVEIFSR